MKKTLLVVALATIMVFALAGSAFALGINHSGQMRLGAAAAANASSPTSATIVGGGTNTYYDWSVTVNYGGNAGDNSPHGNFTTTTVKCVVCHAVHYAAPGGATVASNNQTADTLLRRRADGACVYCHATANQAVNGTPVYDGLGAAIIPGGATGGATNTGHYTGPNCSECHTNVHGANADHTVASLDGFLLKLMSATNVQGTGAPTNNMLDAITVIDNNAVNQGFNTGDALAGTPIAYANNNTTTLREQAVGVFCAECHLGSYANGAPGVSANVYGSGSASYSGHRIAATGTSTWNSTGAVSSGDRTIGTIAWAPAANCKDCHDADDTFGNIAFPHSWGGTKMWLMSAADAGSAKTALPYGTASGAAYNAQSPQLSDGVCLKCHVASGGTSGVGITF